MTHTNQRSKNARCREITGIIRHVDAVTRDITVLAGGSHKLMDVPPDCSILLNGEAVKLRLLQPGDHVRVTCIYRNDVCTARWIDAGVAGLDMQKDVLTDPWKR